MIPLNEILKVIPSKLSREEIILVNNVPADNNGLRTYNYQGLKFEVPDKVFLPGATSRIIHDELYKKTKINDKKIIIIGTGCGVEPVICTKKNADYIYASDIHKESIEIAKRNFHNNINNYKNISFLLSNLFDSYPKNVNADIICFNPPTVGIKFSNDEDIVRNVCTGKSILFKFFLEIKEKNMIDDQGVIMIVISNTSDLRKIITHAYGTGFIIDSYKKFKWDVPYEKVHTFLFQFRKK